MEAEKINAIRSYLSKNEVKYYDVQAELIDHFATAVERMERENPGIPFKEALLKAHRNFGGREGFRKYVLNAEAQVQKKIGQMIIRTLLQFLKWPYLAATAFILMVWHFALSLADLNSMYCLIGFTLAYAAVLLRNYFKLRHLPFFLPKKTTWALTWIFYWLAYIPGYSGVLARGTLEYGYTFSLIYFSFLSLTLIAFYRVPQLAIRETKKLYPRMVQ